MWHLHWEARTAFGRCQHLTIYQSLKLNGLTLAGLTGNGPRTRVPLLADRCCPWSSALLPHVDIEPELLQNPVSCGGGEFDGRASRGKGDYLPGRIFEL